MIRGIKGLKRIYSMFEKGGPIGIKSTMKKKEGDGNIRQGTDTQYMVGQLRQLKTPIFRQYLCFQRNQGAIWLSYFFSFLKM
jgi:hypothetical protein